MDERKGVLETYRVIIDNLKRLPGVRLEDIFGKVEEVEREYEWLKDYLENN